MAVNNSTTLTKYQSAVTIVTAAIANSWYGGLFGTTEGAALDAADPLVAGHVHDGEHIDGHAQKVNLVSHVTGQLRNVNLANDAVTKRNISAFTSANNAIPESEVINGTTYYFLDLSSVFSIFTLTAAAGGLVSGDTTLDAETTDGEVVLRAGPGIILDGNSTANRVTIVNNTRIDVGAIAPGTFVGNSPLVGPTTGDLFSFRADAGIELEADPTSNTLIIRNKNPTPAAAAADPSNFSWLTAGQGRGWNAVQNRLVGTPPANDFAFLYKTVPNDADPDAIIYFNIATSW